jgi:hypothetical protein
MTLEQKRLSPAPSARTTIKNEDSERIPMMEEAPTTSASASVEGESVEKDEVEVDLESKPLHRKTSSVDEMLQARTRTCLVGRHLFTHLWPIHSMRIHKPFKACAWELIASTSSQTVNTLVSIYELGRHSLPFQGHPFFSEEWISKLVVSIVIIG